MVGSPRSWGTGENNFRGQETTQSTQNPGKVRLLSKRGARTWEKRVSKKAPGKKGDLRARLQRDLSAKDSNHLLIQLLVSHWDILRGLITGVRSRRSLLPTWFHRRAGGVLSAELPRLQPQRWGGSGTGMALAPGEQASSSETLQKAPGRCLPPIQGGLSTARLHPARADLPPNTIRSQGQGFCARVCTQQPISGSIPQGAGGRFWWALTQRLECPAVGERTRVGEGMYVSGYT